MRMCAHVVDVVHNWNDEQAGAILSRCTEAGREDSTFLVAERLIDDTAGAITAMDLRMFLFFGGRGRPLAQVREIADTAGPARVSTLRTPVGLNLIRFSRGRA